MSGFIGILMLDTAFPRIIGDVGNPASFPMPVRIRVVDGADVTEIVSGTAPSPALLHRFADAACALEAEGAVGILTSCGFLGHVQRELAEAVSIPLITSALCLGPMIRAMTGGRKIGIITANAAALSPALLSATGLQQPQVAIAGLEDAPAWQRLILAPKAQQATHLDPEEIGALVESRARSLQRANPDIGAILMECTNLPPYADRVRATTGLPVFHILHAADLLWAAKNT